MVNGDTPAASYALGLMGHNSSQSCRFCKIPGFPFTKVTEKMKNGLLVRTKNTTLYPVYFTPLDAPASLASVNNDRMHHSASSMCTLSSYMRTPDDLEYFEQQLDNNPIDLKLLRAETGIKAVTPIWSLCTIRDNYPWSAPEESMHTIYLNCIPQLLDLASGKFFEHVQLITNIQLKTMGQALVNSQKYIPTDFGDKLPNIENSRFEYQASTWFTYSQSLMAIQLLHHLPPSHCGPWSRFLWSMYTSHQFFIEADDIVRTKEYLASFIHYLEV